jgi:hypothetical protein
MELLGLRADATAAQLELERLSFAMISEYIAGRMKSCLVWLSQMNALLPGDFAIALLVERCTQLDIAGVPPDWNGVTKMTSK